MVSSMMPTLANTTTTLSKNVALVCHVNNNVSYFMPCNVKLNKQKLCVVADASMSLGGVKARFGSLRGGGALLERPSFDQSQFDPETQVQEGGDIGQLKDRRGTGSGGSYKVLLLDDERHTENLVAKVLPQAVPSVTPDEARELFNKSKQVGFAVVIVTVKEHAEFYSQMMIRGGLRSTIEPDSNTV